MKKHANYEIPNKKVIRSKQKKGEFTTINYKILRDKRLTSNAKILITHILSDSDDFRYSEQLYINRMNISKTAYYRALKNLIENGYMRKEPIANTIFNYYIISEFGNLNCKTQMPEAFDNLELNEKEIEDKVLNFLRPYHNFFKVNDELLKPYFKMINKGHDYHQIESALINFIEKFLNNLFNAASNIIKKNSFDENLIDEALDILKDEVYNKKIISNYNNIIQKAQQNIKDNRSVDQELVEVDGLNAV